MEVRERIDEAVVRIEPALTRPRVAIGTVAAVDLLAEVPLPHRIGAIATGPQDLGQRQHMRRQLRRQCREAGVDVAHKADTGQMRVDTGEQSSPRRRTHRSRMKVGEPHTFGREAVERRRIDLGAEAADVGVAQIVTQHDHDVGRAGRCFDPWRPPRLALVDRGRYATLETGIRRQRIVHAFSPALAGVFTRPASQRRTEQWSVAELSAIALMAFGGPARIAFRVASAISAATRERSTTKYRPRST